MKNRYLESPENCGFCKGVRNAISKMLPKHLRNKFTDIKQDIPEKKDK